MYSMRSQFKYRSKIIKIIEENKDEYFYNHGVVKPCIIYIIKTRSHEEKMDILDYMKS